MMNYSNHIRVWSWQHAPEELRRLSDNGGDEDWVALIPPVYVGNYIPWLEEGTPYGCFAVNEYSHPELPGYTVRIGCHS